MKQWYNNKTEEHKIVLHQHSAAFNIGTVNRETLNSTLKNAISNSKTLNQCNINQFNIEKMHLLKVKYYNGTILISATITISITTNATRTSAI